MAQLQVDQIINRAGAGPPTVKNSDFIKAWAKVVMSGGTPVFSGTTFAASSLQDLGVGYIGLNATNPFNSANFSAFAASWAAVNWVGKWEGMYSATAFRGDAYLGENTAATDPSNLNFVFCGVLL